MAHMQKAARRECERDNERLPEIAPHLRTWLEEEGYDLQRLRKTDIRCSDCGGWLYSDDGLMHVCLNAHCPLNTPLHVTHTVHAASVTTSEALARLHASSHGR